MKRKTSVLLEETCLYSVTFHVHGLFAWPILKLEEESSSLGGIYGFNIITEDDISHPIMV